MALRRLVQQNNPAPSPRSPLSTASPISSSSNPPPSTPRTRHPVHDLYRSPASTPSISSSFLSTGKLLALGNKSRKSIATGTGSSSVPQRRAIVRKKGFIEKVKSIPSTIAFQVALFPSNVPLPAPRTSARIIGSAMHFLNFVPDTELEWEDMYREGNADSWLTGAILISGAIINAVYLFTRIKIYRLHQNQDLVASPNAKFVSAELDVEPLESLSLATRPPSRSSSLPNRMTKVQQLDMWHPGELEMELFTLYSPVHALVWMAVGTSNWILMLLILGLVSLQLNTLMYSYNTLLKDKEILSAEVMSEYNQRFVYPRINPIRRDVAVMTHQSEVVNVWED
ncbi:hypothetical protein BDQ17DRAFT_1353544 [Cyathus striatus]|nr:hypothetical protein BDQ17DRAFT_1353544 [Cyathus striatus]